MYPAQKATVTMRGKILKFEVGQVNRPTWPISPQLHVAIDVIIKL